MLIRGFLSVWNTHSLTDLFIPTKVSSDFSLSHAYSKKVLPINLILYVLLQGTSVFWITFIDTVLNLVILACTRVLHLCDHLTAVYLLHCLV